MFNSFDIIALGDTGIDTFFDLDHREANVHCALNKEKCQICFNYADKIPVKKMTRTIAGNACNVAVGSRRLGLKSTLVTIVGQDTEGNLIKKGLLEERVNHTYIKQKDRTNASTVLNYEGERTIFVYHEPRDYHFPALPRAGFIYLTSMMIGWEKIIDPLVRYLDRTKTRLAYNPGTYQLRTGVKISSELLARCSILFLNKQEAELLGDMKAQAPIPDLLTALHKLGPQVVVITDGPKGSYVSAGLEQYYLGIFDAPIIERTGAGDAYATGFMAAIHLGKPLVTAMRWGSFESAAVIGQIGPQAGLLHRHEMSNYEQHYRDWQPKTLSRT